MNFAVGLSVGSYLKHHPRRDELCRDGIDPASDFAHSSRDAVLRRAAAVLSC